MISFKQFITEGAAFDLEKFKTDCAFILSELKGGNKLLWHGTDTAPPDWQIKQWKERTEPRDSSKVAHDQFNSLFTKMFGFPIRNWLFTTSYERDAAQYDSLVSKACAIFPIGKFDWVQGQDDNLRDLSMWHARELNLLGHRLPTKDSLSADEKQIIITDMLLKKIPNMKWKHNTDFDGCLHLDNEIMIKCDKFYLINGKSPTLRLILKTCDIEVELQ